jgi:hypothetical protein
MRLSLLVDGLKLPEVVTADEGNALTDAVVVVEGVEPRVVDFVDQAPALSNT